MTSHQPVDDRSAPEILEANALQPVTRCPWQNCVADTFQDEDRAKSHLESHQNALLQSWKGPTTCSWPKCSSSRVFKEKYLLRRHLQNIHVEPLRCPIKGCSYSDPFDKQHDLNRHVKSIHETSRFLCPIESCDSNTIGFSRKDKLVKHMREEHDNDSHLQDSHGDYECALMACSDALPSHFTKEGARLHLISAHKIYRETAGLLIKEVTSDHVIYNSGSARRETVQCQSCYDLLPK
ncbi:hypothetical protein L207DRAFT_506865 [Hyaloscypha variabilis F]|uniref:C2H2-type domain-containing protein n=1 Tax=Hyaloscypha variabilis (strain UAMH 11265 / GT02V1 / F) TaxID=1149755 RepID=A0A2J6SB05_HYAVF|nr:hypothetical protein L207DRAFT_506865 [Hyaloscypha variabilis F]